MGPEYLELVTDLRTVINYGKYSSQVISNSPDWEGTEGEQLFRYQVNGTGWFYYNYFWVNSGWSYLRWAGSSNALVPEPGSITTDMIQTGAVTANEASALLGAWASVNNNQVYQASADGFVTAFANNTFEISTITGYTDTSNPPTTIRAYQRLNAGDATLAACVTFPVKKNNYWYVTGANTVWWIPLGV